VRKNLGIILLGLSGFLLIVGLLALIWAPSKAEKTPLDVNSTTRLTGEAGKLDTSTMQLVTNPVKATSITKTDTKASDDDTAVFVNTSCVVVNEGDVPDCVDDTDPRLFTASTDAFATDRVSALAVDSDKLPADAGPHEGVINKFPFDVEKKTYPYWDGVVGEAVDAVYDRTEDIQGLETYVFKVEVQDAVIEVASGVPGTYDDRKEIFVDPRTGSIVHQTDDQQRYLADGTPALDLQLAFTEEEQKESVKEAEDNISTLNLITTTVPIVGLSAGVIALLAAILLIVGDRRNSGARRDDA
jgi:hypothetical protein